MENDKMEIVLTLSTVKRILAKECQSRIDETLDVYMEASLNHTLHEIANITTLQEADVFADCYMGMSLQDWADSL